jgi:hypothetical protein
MAVYGRSSTNEMRRMNNYLNDLGAVREIRLWRWLNTPTRVLAENSASPKPFQCDLSKPLAAAD